MKYARKRDVVQNGSVGMKYLIKTVLQLLVEKNDEDKFSDWNKAVLDPKQIKYAVLDVDGPLSEFMKCSKTNRTSR